MYKPSHGNKFIAIKKFTFRINFSFVKYFSNRPRGTGIKADCANSYNYDYVYLNCLCGGGGHFIYSRLPYVRSHPSASNAVGRSLNLFNEISLHLMKIFTSCSVVHSFHWRKDIAEQSLGDRRLKSDLSSYPRIPGTG